MTPEQIQRAKSIVEYAAVESLETEEIALLGLAIQAIAARDAETAGMRSTMISDLGREIIAINTANGWNVMQPEQWADTYKVPGVLALIHSEVSEALEAFRKDDKANFIEELADVLIRVLDCSEGLGMDIESAICAKLEKNRGRGFRHGGKRV